jgi:hypothetical protein
MLLLRMKDIKIRMFKKESCDNKWNENCLHSYNVDENWIN